jgi:hypothetical protein
MTTIVMIQEEHLLAIAALKYEIKNINITYTGTYS